MLDVFRCTSLVDLIAEENQNEFLQRFFHSLQVKAYLLEIARIRCEGPTLAPLLECVRELIESVYFCVAFVFIGNRVQLSHGSLRRHISLFAAKKSLPL